MKFLLFNVAVAAALVFLFTADRGEVQKMAGQVHDAAGDMKDYAAKALKGGRTLLGSGAVKTDRKTDPAPAVAPPKPVTQPVKQPVETRPEPTTGPPSEPPVPRKLAGNLAGNLPAMPEIGRKTGIKTRRAASVDLDPDVSRRRREVLDGIDAADAALVLREGTRLMTASERRTELLSLAEEMELLYARSISR
ncbi:MAG: hypothetical protein ACTSQV_06725 [Alphaproteobacteria bacterium]